MKKIVSSFILLFLGLSLCCSLQFVGLVSANFFPAAVPDHSIEITEDGDVNGTDKIQRIGNLYTFTENIVGSIVVFRSCIVMTEQATPFKEMELAQVFGFKQKTMWK